MDKNVKLKGMSGEYKDLEYVLEYDEFTMGRHFDCDLVLKEETVSSRHAKIKKNEGNYEIEDLNSSNGTFINGEKIKKQSLRTGDLISIDKMEFKFINPEEVERTVISNGIKISQPEETVIRERPEGLISEKEKPDTKPLKIKETMKQVSELKKEPYRKEVKNKKSKGIIPALAISLFINYCLAIVFSILRYNRFSIDHLWNYAKPILLGFPFIHTHLFWTMPRRLDTLMILIGISIPLGLMLGGFIKQKISSGSRLNNAFQLSLFYVIFGLVMQLVALGFDIENWMELNSRNNLGIDNFAISVGVTILYFFAFSLLFSFAGTQLAKKK